MDFLVDAQLPPLLCDWIEDSTNYNARHVSTLEKGLVSKDSEIWDIALTSSEIIVTKDFDFYDRALVSGNSPLVLHLNLANCSNSELINYLDENWNSITRLFQKGHALLSCGSEEIEFW